MLFLCWPQTRCTEYYDSDGEIYDQIATASENVVYPITQPNASSQNTSREPLTNGATSSGATARYEKSGFAPMIPSGIPFYAEASPLRAVKQRNEWSEESKATNAVSARGSSSNTKRDKLEEDLAYSSEARIFLNLPGPMTNRRSFDLQEEDSSEFELLKVNNNTPVVADYGDFYEKVRSTVSTEIDKASPSSGSSSGERKKRIENYTRNYGIQSHRTNDGNTYAHYYSYNAAQDTKKTANEREKVSGNYRQQNTANYDGHGQSAVTQNTVSSSTRTNYKVNELTHAGIHGKNNAADLSRIRYTGFSKPVVVVEPTDYKVGATLGNQTPTNDVTKIDHKTSKNLESFNSELSKRHEAHNDNSKQRSYHHDEDSANSSGESTDYSAEHVERLKRPQNHRRRPAYVETTRSNKGQRGTPSDSTQQQDTRKSTASQLKSQRQRVKTNPWTDDSATNHQDESAEDQRGGDTQTKISKVQQRSRSRNKWNHVSPTLEIAHSNGSWVELDHLEKPNYVPLNVNFVPVANFDHATALGNSQGFDVSNALLHNFVNTAPIGAFTTSAPLLTTSQSVLGHNLAKDIRNLGVSTSVPEIVVGQNVFHNPTHTILLSGNQNKGSNYLPTTMTPLFAFTTNLDPTLQNVRLKNLQNNETPVQIPVSQVNAGVQQLLVPQPTIQTLSSFLQANPGYQIQVNSHGLQGQKPTDDDNVQTQDLSTTSTRGRNNVKSQDKKNLNLVASASLAVGQKQTTSGDLYFQNHNTQHATRTKSTAQATQVVPTVVQASPVLSSVAPILTTPQLISAQQNLHNANIILPSRDQTHEFLKLQNSGATSDNAHLPKVGTKNVEILNPNIKPSPLDTTVNTFGTTLHYPATVLSTPIPLFNTVTPVTPQTVGLQNYVNSLTETGTKNKQLGLDPKTLTERPLFNPINFIPNVDIIKNQNSLNNKLTVNEPLQQGLNLVPIMPGGNFFKPSVTAQNELIMKPKLASDLQKYAEEMFKESLRTMYNSQKWNNDKRPYDNGHNVQNSEASDVAKLKLELQKLKASLMNSKYRDHLEAYQTENNVRVTDAPKSGSEKKKHDPLLTTLEQILKNRGPGPIHIYHGSNRPVRKRKPTDDTKFGIGFHDDSFNSDSHLTEFLTPPRQSLYTKGHFQDKPAKKRPGSRYKNGPRKRPSSSRPALVEESGSDIHVHLEHPSHYHETTFENDDFDFDDKRQSFDLYPTFTTSTPDFKDYDINHPRIHNLLGMLMKNRQLPVRNTPISNNYFRDPNQMKQFVNSEKHRLQHFYNDALKNYLANKYEDFSRSGMIVDKKVIHSKNGTA